MENVNQDQFHSNSALNHIIFKKTLPFNFINIVTSTRMIEQKLIDDKLPEATKQRIRSCLNVLEANFVIDLPENDN